MNDTVKINKTKIKMPWVMIGLAFAFLFNPNISIIDVLPDFIGYIIISAALVRPAMISESLADAKKAFERMVLIDAGKYIVLIWVFGIDALSERASSLLLWSFVFGVLEAIFLIPSYVKLFKGMSDLGDYYENSSIHATDNKGKKSFTQKAKNFSVFFIIFKAVMCVLPELTDFGNLQSFSATTKINLYRYIGVIRFLCCVPVLVVGIVWFVSILRYFMRVSKDEALNGKLTEYYCSSVLPKRGLFIIRYVKTASWLFVAFSVLTLDFKLEGINIMPDILSVALIIPAFMYFCKVVKLRKVGTYIIITLYGICTIASAALDKIFLDNYTYSVLDIDAGAFALYLAYVLSVALQGIAFVIMLSLIVKEVRTVVLQHTGYVLGKEIDSAGERERVKEVHFEINKGFSQMLNVAALYVFSDVMYSLYGAIYAFARKDFGFLSVINIACGLFFIGMLVRALDGLKDAVKTKYMLE